MRDAVGGVAGNVRASGCSANATCTHSCALFLHLHVWYVQHALAHIAMVRKTRQRAMLGAMHLVRRWLL